MAKRKKGRGRGSTTIPIAIVAGFGAGLKPAFDRVIDGNLKGALDELSMAYTGYASDGSFDMARLKRGLYPLLAGFAIHYLAGKVGVNRALGKAKIPLIRI